MNWFGDYNLNYNFQAPFMPLFGANHIELTDCYHTPSLIFFREQDSMQENTSVAEVFISP